MPQLGNNLSHDTVFSGETTQDSSHFVKATGVAGCNAGIIWYTNKEGKIVYFAYHESSGYESREMLPEYKNWERKVPENTKLRMLRAVFGQKTPIYNYAASKCDVKGWSVPLQFKPKISSVNKNIEFYPFDEDGKILVDGKTTKDYEKSMGY